MSLIVPYLKPAGIFKIRLNMSAGLRYGTINEIQDMAEGGNAEGIREQYYPGKPDSFFREVLLIVERGER